MPTQEQIDRIQNLLRQQYIILKDEEIRRIILLYGDSIDYLIQVLLGNTSYTTAKKLTPEIVAIMNDALDQSRSRIEDGFRRALTTMIELGAATFTLALLTSSQSKTANKIDELVSSGAERLLNEGGAASSIFGKDLDNKTKALSAEIKKNTANLQGLTISENIWDMTRRQEIRNLLKQGFDDGLSPFAIAQRLKEYSVKGDGLKNAFRLAYSELTHAHAVSQIESVRAWNSDPTNSIKFLIEQYLSPLHTVPDICDVLAGVYDPSESVPKIGRHPNCNCGQRIIIDNEANRKRVQTIQEAIKKSDVIAVNQIINILDPSKRITEVYINGEPMNITDQEAKFISELGIKISNKNPEGVKANGGFDFKNNVLYISKDLSGNYLQSVFRHELGHAIDFSLSEGKSAFGIDIPLSSTKGFRDLFSRFPEELDAIVKARFTNRAIFENTDVSSSSLAADALSYFRQYKDSGSYSKLFGKMSAKELKNVQFQYDYYYSRAEIFADLFRQVTEGQAFAYAENLSNYLYSYYRKI